MQYVLTFGFIVLLYSPSQSGVLIMKFSLTQILIASLVFLAAVIATVAFSRGIDMALSALSMAGIMLSPLLVMVGMAYIPAKEIPSQAE